jgi:hypothetical protein
MDAQLSFIVVVCNGLSPCLGDVTSEEMAPSDSALFVVGFVDELVQGCIGIVMVGS